MRTTRKRGSTLGLDLNGVFDFPLAIGDTTTRLTWNGGGGLEFPLSRGALFLDATYHRIETSRLTEYVPIVIGIRF